MTSYAEIHSAVEAMKQGASDFVAKPIQPDKLLKKIKEAINPPTAEEQIPEKTLPKLHRVIIWKERAKRLISCIIM